jgi:drug/metabolite transporter (DMT)-like permease
MKTLIAFVLMIGSTVSANLLLKAGASADGVSQNLLSGLLSWQTLSGLAFFGAAAATYFVILTWLPLNVAQSFAAAQFIAVILAARVFLAEPIDGAQWFGIAFIATGIAIVGWNR